MDVHVAPHEKRWLICTDQRGGRTEAEETGQPLKKPASMGLLNPETLLILVQLESISVTAA